ncbi:iron complex outermembrane recepter protein [Halopseudomonas sabulinigri]|uniref:Iron complex outermembrane recepter protein n=1 Tax=Halopseudomonas sabulinigri TaxID=472181 RepID=A0A1H1SUW1_9GAMM|nr:TonB-dependent receptor [Halopseudomonas sabulinigri]SDS51772.1 iron complex outermembrane recepter protein [Halopseudomonas sabulinigri]
MTQIPRVTTTLLLALAGPALAAESSIKLPTQTILGSNPATAADALPSASSHVDSNAISPFSLGANLSESLQRVPGVLALNRQNYAQDVQISARGFGARAQFGVRGVRLTQDGIPLTMPDGQGQPALFDLDGMQYIDVLRGPLSALYGNASGGIIQGYSAPAPLNPTLDNRSAVGSDGLWRSRLKYGGQHGDLGISSNISRLETDGYRDHSQAQRDLANLRLDWDIDDASTLTLLLNSLDQPETQDPLGLSAAALHEDREQAVARAEQYNTRKTVRHNQAGVNYQRTLANNDQLTLLVYGGERYVQQYLAFTGDDPFAGGGVIELDRRFGGGEIGWLRDTQLLNVPIELAAGLTYGYQGEGRKGFVNNLGRKGDLKRDEFNRVDSKEAYLISTWALTDQWSLTAGVRHSRVEFESEDDFLSDGSDDSGSADYRQTTPALGISYQWSPALTLYAAAGQGFETPTFQELAYRPTGSGLNFALQPSESVNTEIGFKLREGDTRVDAALFYTRVNDEIVTGVEQATTDRSTYANAGKSTRRGLELALEQRLPWDLNAYLAYTYLDAKFDQYSDGNGDDFSGNYLPGVPRHSLYAELAWQPDGGFSTALEAQSLSKRYATDDNQATAPGYAAFNCRAGYRHELGDWALEPFARLDNLTNKEYIGSLIVNGAGARYYEPAPERNWLVGIGVQYQWR